MARMFTVSLSDLEVWFKVGDFLKSVNFCVFPVGPNPAPGVE